MTPGLLAALDLVWGDYMTQDGEGEREHSEGKGGRGRQEERRVVTGEAGKLCTSTLSFFSQPFSSSSSSFSPPATTSLLPSRGQRCAWRETRTLINYRKKTQQVEGELRSNRRGKEEITFSRMYAAGLITFRRYASSLHLRAFLPYEAMKHLHAEGRHDKWPGRKKEKHHWKEGEGEKNRSLPYGLTNPE